MATRNVVINFLTKLQSKGIDKLNKQTSQLERGFKRLGVGLGGFLSLRQINRLAQQSVKAFIEEDKAVRLLATNLNNLNIAYDVETIEGYIDALQRQTAVIDDELRPAFQQLLISTRSVTKSQELLALSLDIAAATGNSLNTVTRALTRSYLGSNTALSRLNVGISKADLSTKSFEQIVGDLSKRFAGSASTAAATYAGKLESLRISADEAQEVLGKKLVFAVELLLDPDKGIPALGRSVEQTASSIGDFTVGIAKLFSELNKFSGGSRGSQIREFFKDIFFPNVSTLENSVRSITELGRLTQVLPVSAKRQQDILVKQFQSVEDQVRAVRALEKEEAKRAKTAAKIAAEKAKAKAKEQADARAEALRNRLEAKFDIDAINLAAAAQRNLSEQDRTRVEALQALKTDAVEDDKQALTKLIDLERKRAEDAVFASIAVKNQRLSDLEAEYQALLKLAGLRTSSITGTTAPAASLAPGLSASAALESYNLGARNIAVAGGAAFLDFLFSGETVNPTGIASLGATEPSGTSVVIVNNIAGSVLTEAELFETLQTELFKANRAGIPGQLELLGR